MDGIYPLIIGSVAALLVALLSTFRKPLDKAVSAERSRLRTEVLGIDDSLERIGDLTRNAIRKAFTDPDVQNWYEGLSPEAKEAFPAALGSIMGNTLTSMSEASLKIVATTDEATGKSNFLVEIVQDEELSPPATRDNPTEREASLESERFALLLIEYYAYGLAQAKRSLAASLASSAVGGLVLMAGVGLALVRGTESVVPIVTSLAGVLTSGIGALFHRQASQALRHMEGQSRSLRQDMKAERDQHQAITLLSDVSDPSLRARLQAALILRFSGAALPDITASQGNSMDPPSQ